MKLRTRRLSSAVVLSVLCACTVGASLAWACAPSSWGFGSPSTPESTPTTGGDAPAASPGSAPSSSLPPAEASPSESAQSEPAEGRARTPAKQPARGAPPTRQAEHLSRAEHPESPRNGAAPRAPAQSPGRRAHLDRPVLAVQVPLARARPRRARRRPLPPAPRRRCRPQPTVTHGAELGARARRSCRAQAMRAPQAPTPVVSSAWAQGCLDLA